VEDLWGTKSHLEWSAEKNKPIKRKLKDFCISQFLCSMAVQWLGCWTSVINTSRIPFLASLLSCIVYKYNLVLANGRWCSAAGEVTAGMAESIGSLPPSLYAGHLVIINIAINAILRADYFQIQEVRSITYLFWVSVSAFFCFYSMSDRTWTTGFQFFDLNILSRSNFLTYS